MPPAAPAWRWLVRAAAAALLIGAAVVFVSTVSVEAGGSRPAACGSAWDVVAGRSGWQQWWAQDLADPVAGHRLVRTDRCPGAVNGHVALAGGVAAGALLGLAAAEVVLLRRRPRPAEAGAARLRRLGLAVTALGAVLTGAGLTGLVLLTADPGSSLFVYVSRPAVFLAGLLLLLPAVLLIVLGRAATVLAGPPRRGEVTGEPS